MEPHSPYTPPPLTARMFRIGDSPQPIPQDVSIPGWLLPGSPRDLRPYLTAYDDEIAAADAAFDTLLRELRSMRGWRDTIVVLTANHGEEFLDHGGWEHGTNLHDELICVPLVIQAPNSPAGVIDAQVQLIDLFRRCSRWRARRFPRRQVARSRCSGIGGALPTRRCPRLWARSPPCARRGSS
jgi:arylsulfatase A-like enzyme